MIIVQFIPSANPKPPTRQLFATWVVNDWDMVMAELVRNSWTACGYPPEDTLGTTNETIIVPCSPKQTSNLVKRICVPDLLTKFYSIECDSDHHFPESDDDSVDEVELNFD